MRFRSSAIAAAMLLFSSAAVAETVTSYTSLASFQAASVTTLSDNYTGPIEEGPVFHYGPFTYSIDNNEIYIFHDDAGYSNSVTTHNAAYLVVDSFKPTVNLTITFASSSAVGFYLGDFYGAEDLNIDIGGSTFQYSIPNVYGSEVFAGFTTTGTFNNVVIHASDEEVDVVQSYLGTSTVAPTPEPSSLALLGTGVLGVIGAARRRFAA